MRMFALVPLLVVLAACGGEDVEPSSAPAPSVEAAPATVAPEPDPAPTTEAPTVEPPEVTTPEPAPEVDQGDRAMQVLEEVGYPGTCDDEARTEGQLAIAGCAGEELGAVWVLVPPSPSDVDELASEVMNDLFASACVGDDYVVAAFAIAGAEHVTASGLDCDWP